MGINADDTGNPRRTKVTEDFTVPPECLVTSVCGNSIVELGEQCDEGDTLPGDCCSAACQFESAATECRASAGVCDVADFCTGSTGTCPADGFEPGTTECRASAGVCDAVDLCTGSSPTCPADAKSTSECRAAGGTCDVAEVCDGVSDDCPADQVDPGLCADGNPCTLESCVALECQIDPIASDTPCPDGDVCNGDETCQLGVCTSGMSLTCDDGEVCTADSCDPLGGCTNEPILECVVPAPVPALQNGALATLIALLAAAGVAIRKRRPMAN
jgi:cysteine-rich repeat protein